MGTGPGGVGARQHAGVGEGHQRHGETAQQHGTQVVQRQPGQAETGQALGQGTQYLEAIGRVQVKAADHQGGGHHRDEDTGHAVKAREPEDDRQRTDADGEGRPVGLTFKHCLTEGQDVAQRAAAVDGDAEQLGRLADQHGEGDAVHVAIADRLGQQFGDEPQAQQPGTDADQARHQGHGTGQRDGAHGVASGQRQDHGDDDRRQRRVGAQYQDAAGAEQGIGQQRNDRGVQAVDARNPRGLGIGDAHRDQHGGQHQAGNQVLRQPGGLVAAQQLQPWQPALPAGQATVLRGRCLPGFGGLDFAHGDVFLGSIGFRRLQSLV
ncbi:hypothetical protein D3C85_942970 [compost metagenome]